MTDNLKNRNITLVVVSILCAVSTLVAFAAGGFALIVRFGETNLRRDRQVEINKAVCAAAASDRASLRALVIQADSQLGTPKSAGYTYYRTHPDELVAAHLQNHNNLSKYLPVIKCTAAGKAYKPGG